MKLALLSFLFSRLLRDQDSGLFGRTCAVPLPRLVGSPRPPSSACRDLGTSILLVPFLRFFAEEVFKSETFKPWILTPAAILLLPKLFLQIRTLTSRSPLSRGTRGHLSVQSHAEIQNNPP